MNRDPLDLAATPERLRALVAAGVLSPDSLPRALELAVRSPPEGWWRRFVSVVLLGLGTLLVLSGVVYFFAFNWAELHRFGKLGLIAGAIACSAVIAWRLGEGLPGQVALLFAAALVGPLLAVYGQAYQTGADPWELFLGWAALIALWVGLARFAALWLLLLGIVNVGLALFWEQALGLGDAKDHAKLVLTLSALNGLAWATVEHFAFRHRTAWLQSRWLPRVLALMTFAPLLATSTLLVLDRHARSLFHALNLFLLLGVAALSYVLHRKVRSELFLVTLIAASGMVLLTSFAGRQLFNDVGGSAWSWLWPFLTLGLLLAGEVAAVVLWLRTEARLRGTEDV